MGIRERILQYLDYKKITPTKTEALLSWGKGTLTKVKGISADKAGEFLLLFDDISAEWLMRGKGDMLIKVETNTAEEEQENDIEFLKAQLNQLIGENRILREQLILAKLNETPGKSA